MSKKEYINEFPFTESLTDAIGTIISQEEGKDYLVLKHYAKYLNIMN